jgi:hypothetical protein
MDFSKLPGHQQSSQESAFYSKQGPNVIYGAGGFDNAQAVTHPTEKVSQGKHIYVVDSRQRDCKLYPTPSNYRIPIEPVFKNVTSIELKGCILPKTAYGVHDSNNVIDFSIGDAVTSFVVLETGGPYPVAPVVTVEDPISGTTATGTAVLNANGAVTSITIGVGGSGYRSSTPPQVTIAPSPTTGAITATAKAVIGTTYKALLRPGNYTIGGNNVAGAVPSLPTGLLLEVQNAMNYAFNGGVYDPASTAPFAVRLVSQYPEIDAVAGTPEAFDTNACPYNRIQIINTDSDPWELLWCSGKCSDVSARRLLGFPWVDQVTPTATAAIGPPAGDILQAGTSYRGLYDYDLSDAPNYAILSFWSVADESFERIDSVPGDGLNRAFATMVFDANSPDNLHDLDGTANTDVGGVNYLEGAATKGTFYTAPGNVKPLKGYDFDQKYLEFSPAIGKLSSLNINFTKFGSESGGIPHLYNFMGRDHLLIFQLTQADTKSGNRWS